MPRDGGLSPTYPMTRLSADNEQHRGITLDKNSLRGVPVPSARRGAEVSSAARANIPHDVSAFDNRRPGVEVVVVAIVIEIIIAVPVTVGFVESDTLSLTHSLSSTHTHTLPLCLCLSACLSACLSGRLPACLSVALCLSVCLSHKQPVTVGPLDSQPLPRSSTVVSLRQSLEDHAVRRLTLRCTLCVSLRLTECAACV